MKNSFIIKEKFFQWPVFAFFAFLILLFYGNTLFNGFVHDDIGQIVQNEYVQSLRYLPKVFSGCIWENVFGDCRGLNYYRPMQSLSYLLTWQVSSSPWFFHLVNLLYFFTAVSLIFLVAKKLTKNSIISFFAALFFLAHPINNEVVNWISAAPELLMTIFVLLSTLFFIKYREESQLKYLIFSAVFYVLAIFSKEPAIFLPAVFVLMDWRLFGVKFIEAQAPQAVRKRPRKTGEKSGSDEIDVSSKIAETDHGDYDLGVSINLYEIAKYAVFTPAILAFLGARMLVLGSLFGGRQPYFDAFSMQERIYAAIILFAQYAAKIVYPYPLLFYHYFEQKASFLSITFVLSLFVVIAFLALLCVSFWRKWHLFFVFFAWGAIFLLPALVLVDYAGENVFSERYFFLSNAGLSILSGALFYSVWKKKKFWRIYLLGGVVLLLFSSWLVVYPRNKIFKDDFSLYREVIRSNPKAYAVRRNLAVELIDAGKYEEAKVELDKIMESAPTNWWEMDKVYNNLGNYYRIAGDPTKAEEYYIKSIEISEGRNDSSFNNLGAMYMEKGDYLQSLRYLCGAVSLDPNDREANNNFNRISTLLDSVESEDGLRALYADIARGDNFQEGPKGVVAYLGGRLCEEGHCNLTFWIRFGENKILLPFLFFAANPDGEVIKIKNRAFNAQNGTVTIDIPNKYIGRDLEFMFPACDGKYYKASTADVKSTNIRPPN